MFGRKEQETESVPQVQSNNVVNNPFDTTLSSEEAKNLKNLNYGLNKYVSLKDGDKVNWQFNPRSVEKVTNKFDNERTRFEIYDPQLEHAFIWDAPNSAARKVLPLLTQGFNYLHIERIGADKETRYDVTPFGGSN